MNQELNNLVELYRDQFLPIYSELVARLIDKPLQTLIEIENIFTHIMNYLDQSNSTDIQQKNLEKAYNHLSRLILDSYKIIWVEVGKEIDKFFGDRLILKFGANLSENNLKEAYIKFKNLGISARKLEIETVGKSILASIEGYEKAIKQGDVILRSFDIDKIRELEKFSLWDKVKSQSVGIFLSFPVGVGAGILATYIWTKWS